MSAIEYLILGMVIGSTLVALFGAFYDELEDANRASARHRQQRKTQALTESALAEASRQAANLNAVALHAATTLLDEAIRAGVVNNTPTSDVSAKHNQNPANPSSHRFD